MFKYWILESYTIADTIKRKDQGEWYFSLKAPGKYKINKRDKAILYQRGVIENVKGAGNFIGTLELDSSVLLLKPGKKVYVANIKNVNLWFKMNYVPLKKIEKELHGYWYSGKLRSPIISIKEDDYYKILQYYYIGINEE